MMTGTLTLREVLADIPHDGVSIVLYILLALCLAAVWRAGRSREETPEAGSRTSHDSSGERST